MLAPLQVAIVGPGNLARSLVPNLQRAGISVRQVFSRLRQNAQAFADQWSIPLASALTEPIDSNLDLVLITTNDAGIPNAVRQLAHSNVLPSKTIFAHTSGSTPLSALDLLGQNVGVFYPLQMFTKAREVDLQSVPLFLEGRPEVYQRLESLASQLSTRVHPLDSDQRLRMHLGAVWVANFPNHLYRLAQQELAEANLSFEVYQPLLLEQVRRVFELGPEYTQTGPAVRGDLPTLEKHLELLAESPELYQIYIALSKLINPALESHLPA